MNKLYIAYGSNLNKEQMAYRCPAARPLGTAILKDWRLVFRGWPGHGVLDIEPYEGGEVPVGIWEITPACEWALNRYEGFPSLYIKRDFLVKINGKGHAKKAMAYIMVGGHTIEEPSRTYFNVCKQGYDDFGFDSKPLYDALDLSR